ncbi:Zuotin and related molecular chaperones (DnaJ superfamily), contains DNA-binding domains [Phaffia rhodozyma]|uniref:Zuotin and related molecular chaperones (DnaJ superfamily), contains DNA-binding domains n=1 Tax=Phaffia rhodozyma TaxID=264483 RepID=A0A0F7SHX4_PHARH|nr:Zuotin and related molecular chaperones (DnaJ superfamily), contains DNA-binding domains [Phaffia rhodozyma]
MSRPAKRKPRATLLLFDPLNSPVKPVAPRKSPLSLSVFAEEEEGEGEEEEEEEEEEEVTRELASQDREGQPGLFAQVDNSLYSIYSDPSSSSSLASHSFPSSHSGFLVDVGSPEKQGSLVGDLIGDFDDHGISRTRYIDENEVDSLLMSLDSPVQSKTTDKPGPDRTSSMETPVRTKYASQPSFDSPSTPSTVIRPSHSTERPFAESVRAEIPDFVMATPVVLRTTRTSSPPHKSNLELPEPGPSVQSADACSVSQDANESTFAHSSTENSSLPSVHTISHQTINPWEVPLPSSPPSELFFFLTAPDKQRDEGSLLLDPPQLPPASRAPTPSFFFDVTDTSFDLLADATLPEGLSMSTLRAPSPMLHASQDLTEETSFIMKSPATSRSPAPKRPDGRAPSPFADSSFDLLDESLPDIPPETSFALPPPTPRSGAATRFTHTHAALLSTPSQATPTAPSKIQRNPPPSSSPLSFTPRGPSITLSVPSPNQKFTQRDALADEGDTTLNLDDHFKNEDMSFCHLPGMSLELDGEDDRWDVSFAGFAAQTQKKKSSVSNDLEASLAPSRLALATAQPDLLTASLPPPEETVSHDPWDVVFVHDKARVKGESSKPSLSTSTSSNSSTLSASSSRTATLAYPSSQRSILAPTNREAPVPHKRTPSLPRENSRPPSSSTKILAPSAQATPRPIRKSPSISSTLDFQQTPRSSVQSSHGRSKSLASHPHLDSPSLTETPIHSKPLPFSRLNVRLSAASSPRTTRDASCEKPVSREEPERIQSRIKPSASIGSLAREAPGLPSSRSSSISRSASGSSTLNHTQPIKPSISTPSAPRRTSRPVSTPKFSLTSSIQPAPSNPPPLTLRPSASVSLVPSRSIPKPSIKAAIGAQPGTTAAGAPTKRKKESLALCLTSVWAWDKDDHEIFDIVAALEKAEGKGTTFYSFLDVPPSASKKEIGKAYRTKSVAMHPDKNPGDKTIQDRFARLGVISTILRDDAGRKRYDFFYKNGVPKWKGTGYFYARWRPGFFFTVFFLALVSSGFQYIFQRMNHSQDLGRINDLISKAQLAAWGPNEKFRDSFARKKVTVPVGTAGRQADLLVMQDGDVLMLDPPNEPTLLSASMLVRPTYAGTWPVALGRSLGEKFGLIKPDPNATVSESDSEVELSGASASDGEVVAESSAVSTGKKAKKGKPTKRR